MSVFAVDGQGEHGDDAAAPRARLRITMLFQNGGPRFGERAGTSVSSPMPARERRALAGTAPVLPSAPPHAAARFAWNADTLSTKIRVSAPSSSPSCASRARQGKGNVSTHWRSATSGSR
jgi:hypothetical protein